MPVRTWTYNDRRYSELNLKAQLYEELYKTVRIKAEDELKRDNPNRAHAYIDVCDIIMDKITEVINGLDALKAELEEELKSLI